VRALNLDTLVSAGQPPWQPTAAAQDVDVWDKYDFPLHGTYRLGDELVVFTLITTAGSRSLWAYVPVSSDMREAVTAARFNTEAEFNAFLDELFARREAVLAAAENFVVTSKSDGILIQPGRNGLMAAGLRWYTDRAAALAQARGEQAANEAEAENLLHATQEVLASLPA
jgi:hypothetical protein